MQLNFQTRFIHSGGSPEILVLDGAPELFSLAMANGNAVFGFLVDEDSTPKIPEWANCSHIDISAGALFWRKLDNFPGLMQSVLRDRIGCLALHLPCGGGDVTINTRERYAHITANFFDDSYFVLMGGATAVLTAAATMERAEPEARIVLRVYDDDMGERRAILIATGLSSIPELIL